MSRAQFSRKKGLKNHPHAVVVGVYQLEQVRVSSGSAVNNTHNKKRSGVKPSTIEFAMLTKLLVIDAICGENSNAISPKSSN
ncbi:hypothetical protein GN958_ATG11654 [Phytophthora infestans]|uniref:Uncharacterized protein n=1 Tax=Phytophthora infestans TaxID=4787 RepID=A0A8S9UF02_PHYIN|nr:hypothetical protein GN958_ATG11654 [Phytophthora infestans]